MDRSSRHGTAKSQIGDLTAIVQLISKLPAPAGMDLDGTAIHRRKMVAELCRFVGSQLAGVAPPPASDIAAPAPHLAPRVRQTLDRLLAGDSEKQIALRLGVTRNTAHCYVKDLYRHYKVCSRGELLARFINPGSPSPDPRRHSGSSTTESRSQVPLVTG